MTAAANRSHRGTIFLEDARVLSQAAYPGGQFVLQVEAPDCARRAVPGSFAHIQCAAGIPMRRPLSIMRADADTGVVEFLYKIVGSGLRALSQTPPDDMVSILAPIGNGFTLDAAKPRKLMLGGGVGIPPMVFLAEHLHATGAALDGSLVLMGSELPFPFEQAPAAVAVAGLPAPVTDSMPDLDALGVPVRLTSLQGFTGCYQGYVTELAAIWLDTLTEQDRQQVELFACGPEPMLAAAAKLAADYDLPCQLCLEEFMACAVGGCAGCTIPVYSDGAMAMKRVCVDGPVFSAAAIYPEY